MQDRAELAGLYPLRADEARTIAAGILDWEERKKLMQIADEYEQRARDVEGMDGPTLGLDMI